MGFDPFEKMVDRRNRSPSQEFEADRLDRPELTKGQWPAQIDRAALDVLYGIAVGKGASKTDIGGTIDRDSFPEATGEFYVEGLQALAGGDSDLARSIVRYDETAIGKLAFHLSEFRKELGSMGEEMDVDRAVEALVEKAATEALANSARVDGKEGAGLRQLRDSNSTTDLVAKLFSDPRVAAYAQGLIDVISETEASRKSLLARLDEPRMTTPLWDHQSDALRNWVENEQTGYVDMATATGKTVLGLAAIALRYGALHPVDAVDVPASDTGTSNPRVLIVAGNEVLLSQWRDEFDEHLDIPPARTVPTESDHGMDIELGWGTVEFRTAQALLGMPSVSDYDLVILDEAHRYSRSAEGRGWGDLFGRLVEKSGAVLAMSGSIDGGWQGDSDAKDALEEHLDKVFRFSVPEARHRGVIADFSWEVHYAQMTPEDESNLAEQTEQITAAYDSLSGKLDASHFGIDTDLVRTSFDTYDDLRSFAQTNAGNELRGRSDEFDLFAGAVLSRKTYAWNASPVDNTIVDLVTRHAPAQKTVVIVREYADAVRLRDHLVDREGFDPESVVGLEGRDDDRIGKIEQFNAMDGGVIIGPGDLLGIGVNMPDAEVAVNVARGGANASLVQRIGRVLRNPRGDKEATFYHVVPQATEAAALDRHEDGRRLLQEAAEFCALGETFKETPGFTVHTDQLGETVADLERAGERLLRRVDDDRVATLVKTDGAREALGELLDSVRAADEENREGSVVVDHWTGGEGDTLVDAGTDGTSVEDGPFTQRDDRYEQYRLKLDQYRAAKAVSKNVLEADHEIHRENGTYVVYLTDEYEGTSFHEHFQRWTNEYRALKRELKDAEGSLPQYRERWPAPREEDGAMVQEEVAAAIGVDYSREDPLFFPRVDGELYELPLPDGQVLAVDGLEVREGTDGTTAADGPSDLGISATVAAAVTARAEQDDRSFDDLVGSWSRDLLTDVVQENDLPFTATPEGETVPVELPEDIRPFIEAIGDSENSFSDPSGFVETAVMVGLGAEPGAEAELTVRVPALLKQATDRDDLDVEAVVTAALRDAVR